MVSSMILIPETAVTVILHVPDAQVHAYPIFPRVLLTPYLAKLSMSQRCVRAVVSATPEELSKSSFLLLILKLAC